MSIVVGTLTIDLKANTASFSQSMDKMSQLTAKSANDIKRSLEKIGTAAVALATGLAANSVNQFRKIVELEARIGELEAQGRQGPSQIDAGTFDE